MPFNKQGMAQRHSGSMFKTSSSPNLQTPILENAFIGNTFDHQGVHMIPETLELSNCTSSESNDTRLDYNAVAHNSALERNPKLQNMYNSPSNGNALSPKEHHYPKSNYSTPNLAVLDPTFTAPVS